MGVSTEKGTITVNTVHPFFPQWNLAFLFIWGLEILGMIFEIGAIFLFVLDNQTVLDLDP